MTLIVDAENAEDIADAFSKFKAPVPDHAADITASISDLYAIGSGLRSIDAALNSVEYSRNRRLIDQDLELVCLSLQNTLEDIFRILGHIGNGSRVLNDGMYRQTWKEISLFFILNGQIPLRTRLEKYKRFILELADIVKRKPHNTPLVGGIRGDLLKLIPSDDRLNEALKNNLSLEPRAPLTKPRSYEKNRPTISPPPQPIFREHRPPSVPEVPTSPSVSTQVTSQSSSTDEETEHWASRVFRDTSTTPLAKSGDISRCYGQPDPQARARLKEEFEEIFEISFSQNELTVRLYYREGDHRARILCKWPRRSGVGYKYSCLPLNVLEFHRAESSLQICRKRPGSSKPDLWASLKFSTIERLVIFFCTLLSLRGHDACKPVTNIKDHELAGEKEVYAGQIIDDNYLHALYVFRDRDSKAVRLQASILQGEMKRIPVWTAFITHYLASSTWLRPASPTLVYLRELRPHIFSSEYTPQMTARGEHVLKFTSEEDAKAFIHTIEDLGEGYARPPPLPAQPQPQFQPMPPPPPMHHHVPQGHPLRNVPYGPTQHGHVPHEPIPPPPPHHHMPPRHGPLRFQ